MPLSDRLDWCLSCCRMLLPLNARTLRFWQIYWFLSLMIWEDINSNYFVPNWCTSAVHMTKIVPRIFHCTSLGISFKICVYIFIFFFLNICYGWWLSLSPNPTIMLRFPHKRKIICLFFFFKTFIWKVETWPLEDNPDSLGMLAIQLKSTEKSNLCLKFICSFFLVNSLSVLACMFFLINPAWYLTTKSIEIASCFVQPDFTSLIKYTCSLWPVLKHERRLQVQIKPLFE